MEPVRAPRIRDAATVMLVRDAPDLEVLVLRRTLSAVFGPGATVFPGGAVDDGDHHAHDFVHGLDDDAASIEQGLSGGGLAYRVAAARECFEESGILLARDAATGLHPAPRDEWRAELNAGEIDFATLMRREKLVLDARDLVLFAHWLTPIGPPRRYDTWFFVAHAPAGHVAAHDDNELVESAWVRPRDVLRAHAAGDVDLILPTERSIAMLARFASTGELFGALASAPRDEHGRPFVAGDVSGERVILPGDEVPPAHTWAIPLPDIDYREEARLVAEGR